MVLTGQGWKRSPWSVYPTAQFTGAKHGEELEPLFATADLFVLPGTGGLAVQQAMAHALPVMVGEADGTQAELVRKENGWLLHSVTVESLSMHLADALSDVARLRQMGMASYRIVSEEVNLEMMVDALCRCDRDCSQAIINGRKNSPEDPDDCRWTQPHHPALDCHAQAFGSSRFPGLLVSL